MYQAKVNKRFKGYNLYFNPKFLTYNFDINRDKY